jgi:ATP/maltotriose-dependent transcriptional regulator MalT
MKTIVIKTQQDLDVLQRLVSRTKKNNLGCWVFAGSLSKSGYGKMSVNGKQEEAHRVSYRLFKGEIPNLRDVAHDCDNPSCINPCHLRLLTRSENHRDSVKRGRIKTGFNSSSSKLNKAQCGEVLRLKGTGWSNAQIGRKFNVATETIRRIIIRYGHEQFKEFFA